MAINNLDKQTIAVNVIDETTTQYIEQEKDTEINIDFQPEINNSVE